MTKAGCKILLAFSMLTMTLPLAPSHAGPNKILNPGFEASYVPAAVLNALADQGIHQPVWPTNWLAEGATELFDHTHNAFRSGNYAAGISGSWGVPRSDCSVQCTGTLPGAAQRDQVYGSAYSEAPAWRTDVPVAVTPSTTYTLSYYVQMSIVMDGSGAVSWVRWYDANRAPIIDSATNLPAYSKGPSAIVHCTPGSSYTTFAQGDSMLDSCHSPSWSPKSGTVTSPAGARFATVLFGYSDSAWIGQVIYDDVFFG